MPLTRRSLLAGSATVAFGLSGPGPRLVAQTLEEGLTASDLVYLTPLRSDGTESRCQAEIWFVYDGADLFVVTATDAWRAEAVRRGLAMARFWVGDLGNWQRTDGAYRSLPRLEARGSFVTGDDEQARILALYGEKYPLSWFRWGPRFRRGLADGTRVMLRYQPAR